MTQKQAPSPEELILTMLREVLARQAAQMGLRPEAEASQPESPTPIHPSAQQMPAPPPANIQVEPPKTPLAPAEFQETEDPLSPAEARELAEFNQWAAQVVVPSRLPRTLTWFMLGVLGLLVLLNIPLFNGLALARALPDRQAFIIRDGLVLKGSGPEIYVLEDNTKRWISSLDAFEHYGYQWNDVHLVEDDFLNQFPDGRPLHVLLKCGASPHIYRLENDRKRWIKDILTFEAEGHLWEDVRFVSCAHLRTIPDGPPIPPGAGSPPQP
ncbi:MAG: hypothetical protein ACRDH2_04475 [Anaerolineales bacterium]